MGFHIRAGTGLLGMISVTVHGHFGEWLQGRFDPAGEVALVTVRCPALGVTVEHLGDGSLCLEDPARVLPPDRAHAILDRLALRSGRFRLIADMPPGGGAGASTAALVALARAAGHSGEGLAVACVAVEGASDPLMLPEPDRVLWAPRRAEILKELAPPPAAIVVGGFWGRPFRTRPADMDFPDVSDLVSEWRRAETVTEAAAIASESARRTSAQRGPKDDPTEELVRDLGALGHLRAHTGSARGLIFAPGDVPDRAEAALSAAGFKSVLTFATGRDAA